MSEAEELEQELEQLTTELVEVQDQLLALYDLAGVMRGCMEAEPLLAVIADHAAGLVGGAGGFAAMPAGEAEPLLVRSGGVPPIQPDLLARLLEHFRVDAGPIVESIAGTGRLLVVGVPLPGRPSAVLGVLREGDGGFTMPEQKLVAAIGSHAGSRLEAVMLHEEILRRTRMELEFELARSIQAGLAPAVPGARPSLDVHAESRASS